MPDVLKGLLVLILLFVPMERFLVLHGQKVLRQGWLTDLFYYFSGYFIGKGTLQILLLATLLSQQFSPDLSRFVTSQPIWLQFVEAVAIAELGYYFAHRLLHTIPFLWKFHAIHHSSTNIDWLATVKVHPFDQIFTKTFQIIPLYVLGFSIETLAVYALFSSSIAFFIHANLRVRLPILRWIVMTPELHHWHHSDRPQFYGKNLAAQLPIFDWLFGTLYMPDRSTTQDPPSRYGIPESIPNKYLQQFIYPFLPKKLKD